MDGEIDDGFIVRDYTPETVDGFIVRDYTPKDPMQDYLKNFSEHIQSQGESPEEALMRLYESEEEVALPVFKGAQEAFKGQLSGASLGLSKLVPGLKPEENTPLNYLNEFAGSVLPVTKLFTFYGDKLGKLAQKSPYFKNSLNSLANITGAALTGATVKGAEDIGEGKVPSAEDLLEHGLTWGALDAGLGMLGTTGKFFYNLFKKSSQTGKSKYEIIKDLSRQLEESGIPISDPERVSLKALEILETPATEVEKFQGDLKRLEQRKVTQSAEKPLDIKEKLDQSAFEPLDKLLKTPEVKPVERADFTRDIDNLSNDALAQKIESAGERAATQEELGTAIKENIETNFEAEKEAYKPFYEQAKEEASQLVYTPEKTGRLAGDLFLEMQRLKTKPESFGKVVNRLETTISDMGYKIIRDTEGNIEEIISEKPVAVKDLIDLAQRVNSDIDYESLEPSVKNVMKKIVNSLKQDIRAGLKQSPDALAAFELAEAEHGRVAEKYAPLKGVRSSEKGENIAKQIYSPTTLRSLQESLSPEQYKKVEREILETLQDKSYDASKKTFRELKKFLSDENKKIAEEIIESKNPFNPGERVRLAKEGVIEDLQNSVIEGTRPNKTLNMWKTKKGQRIIKDALKDNPNKSEFEEYLSKQTFADEVKGVINNKGTLDKNKLRQILDDPATLESIRIAGGDEAVQFFKKLEPYMNHINRNYKFVQKRIQQEAKLPISDKIKTFYDLLQDTFGLSQKQALTFFGIMTFGLKKTIPALVGLRAFEKLLVNPKVRQAFKDAALNRGGNFDKMIQLENLVEQLTEKES